MKKYLIVLFLLLVGILIFPINLFAQQGGFLRDSQQGFIGDTQTERQVSTQWQMKRPVPRQNQNPRFQQNRQRQPDRPRQPGSRQRQNERTYQGGFSGDVLNPDMNHQPITVNEALKLPHNSWVVLTGNIINMLPGGKTYTFKDSSGEIIVDIGPREWRGLTVRATDNVEIYGEIKNHRGRSFVKVRAIRKL